MLDKGIWRRPPQAQSGPPDPDSETLAGHSLQSRLDHCILKTDVGGENIDHQIGRTAPPGMISRDTDHTPVLVTADGGQSLGWTKGAPQDRSRVVPLKGSRLRLMATRQAPTKHAPASWLKTPTSWLKAPR